MSRASERRAALQQLTGEVRRSYVLNPVAEVLTEQAASPSIEIEASPSIEIDTEESMKLQFTSVWFHSEIPRLDAGKGLASHTTSFFDTEKSRGITIELDTATQLVRISIGSIATYVPVSGVKRFGPTLEDSAALVKVQRERAEAARIANELAAAEAEALAQQPA